MQLTIDENLAVPSALRRIERFVSSVLGRDLTIGEAAVERSGERIAANGGIHISFRFDVDDGAGRYRGALLVPYAEAVTLAATLLELQPDVVRESRLLDEPDETMKEAMLELSVLFADAVGRALRESVPERVRVRSAGCQGVRAGRRPALAGKRAGAFAVARAEATFWDFEPFELVLLLPVD